ncbi:hypothetical protein PRIPAC_89385 [Pristionchus pacificus]|uniref:Uncharacterized protein n=1 Tax=Pristionchus pacificus TaxID=54126 RepID=A0A2A6CW19_PRIPA|nr:hypothetical protein PRIPAC_89385 [Pristionchus pacificus]|eukprot:PDM82233.1 hypothetical protein PRIPAC_36626 [Pristionchus pacificus]
MKVLVDQRGQQDASKMRKTHPNLRTISDGSKLVRMDLLATTTRAHRATIGLHEHAGKFGILELKHQQTTTTIITDVDQPLTVEAYAAIVIGVLILLLVVAGLICFCRRGKGGRPAAAAAAPASGPASPEVRPMINKADLLRQ